MDLIEISCRVWCILFVITISQISKFRSLRRKRSGGLCCQLFCEMVHNMLSILLQFLARLNTSAYCASQNILLGTYFFAFCFLGLWWSNETNSYEFHLSLCVKLVICVKSCLLLQKEGATPWVAKNARNEISHSDEIVFSKLSMHFLYFRLW